MYSSSGYIYIYTGPGHTKCYYRSPHLEPAVRVVPVAPQRRLVLVVGGPEREAGVVLQPPHLYSTGKYRAKDEQKHPT